MLRVHQLALPLDDAMHLDDAMLRRMCARALKVAENRIAQVRMSKRSVDARGREGAKFTLTVDVTLRESAQEERLASKTNLTPSDKSLDNPDTPTTTSLFICLYLISISLPADNKNEIPLIKNSTAMPWLA